MNPPTMASRRVWIGKLQRREQEEVQSDILIRPPYRDYVRVIKNKFALVVSIQKGGLAKYGEETSGLTCHPAKVAII